MSKRSKRRADGSYRPTVARRRERLHRERRKAWLAEFEPGVRHAFFEAADLDRAVFARPAAKIRGTSVAEAEALLARMGTELGWLRLETRSGRVVGIAPLKAEGPPERA